MIYMVEKWLWEPTYLKVTNMFLKLGIFLYEMFYLHKSILSVTLKISF